MDLGLAFGQAGWLGSDLTQISVKCDSVKLNLHAIG